METKLTIDFCTKKLEVVGSEAFVEKIYFDFKKQISNLDFDNEKLEKKNKIVNKEPSVNAAKKSRPKTKRKNNTLEVAINKDLDFSGIESYYKKFKVKTDAERTLVFVKFLKEVKKKNEITISDIKTCFFAMKSEFNQPNLKDMFKNDVTRTKYLNRSDELVEITRIGENHFNRNMQGTDD